jgi:hypothetical protein
MLQRPDDISKLKPVNQRERGLPQDVIRIWVLPMMSGAKRDCREIRGLLPQPSWSQSVRVCGFD